MKNRFLKIVITTVFVIFSIHICGYIVTKTAYSLKPFYVEANNIVSEDTVNDILLEKYPDAYFPYKNLDHKIKDYSNIEHIYELTFTQKQPIYAYTMTTSTLGTYITYLVVFDAQGYIQDIVFLNGTTSFYFDTFYSEDGVVDTLVGSKAPHLESVEFTNEMITSNYILKSVKSAAKNLVYEVLN